MSLCFLKQCTNSDRSSMEILTFVKIWKDMNAETIVHRISPLKEACLVLTYSHLQAQVLYRVWYKSASIQMSKGLKVHTTPWLKLQIGSWSPAASHKLLSQNIFRLSDGYLGSIFKWDRVGIRCCLRCLKKSLPQALDFSGKFIEPFLCSTCSSRYFTCVGHLVLTIAYECMNSALSFMLHWLN